MNNREFDDIIQNNALQHESDVPPGIWDAISKKKKRRRIPFFWFFVIVVVAGGGLLWNLSARNKSPQYNSEQKLSEQKNPIDNKSIKTTDEKPVSEREINLQAAAIAELENKVSGNSSESKANQERNTHTTPDPVVKENETKQQASEVNTQNKIPSNKKSFRKNGRTTVHIIPGETKNSDLTKDRSELYEATNTVTKTPVKTQASILPGEADDELLDISESKNSATGIIKTTGDTLQMIVKQIIVESKVDSLEKNTFNNNKPGSAPLANKKKKSSVRIEAGFTTIFPTNVYSAPLQVKRTVHTALMHSAFMSDNVKTNIEQGLGIDFSIVKNIHRKWRGGVGLQYLRFTEHIRLSGLQTNTNLTIVQRLVADPGGSYLKTDTTSTTTTDQTTITGRNVFNSFSIPLFVRYQFATRNNLSFAITTGAYLNYINFRNNLSGDFETRYAGGNKTSDGYNKIGVDIMAGICISGKLYKGMNWFVSPVYRYDISGREPGNLTFNKKIHKPSISFGVAF